MRPAELSHPAGALLCFPEACRLLQHSSETSLAQDAVDQHLGPDATGWQGANSPSMFSPCVPQPELFGRRKRRGRAVRPGPKVLEAHQAGPKAKQITEDCAVQLSFPASPQGPGGFRAEDKTRGKLQLLSLQGQGSCSSNGQPHGAPADHHFLPILHTGLRTAPNTRHPPAHGLPSAAVERNVPLCHNTLLRMK